MRAPEIARNLVSVPIGAHVTWPTSPMGVVIIAPNDSLRQTVALIRLIHKYFIAHNSMDWTVDVFLCQVGSQFIEVVCLLKPPRRCESAESTQNGGRTPTRS